MQVVMHSSRPGVTPNKALGLMKTSLRAAITADSAFLASIHAAASASMHEGRAEHSRDDVARFSELVQEHAGLIHIAEVDGSVGGYVALKQCSHPAVQSKNPLQLWQLYVAPTFHRRGIASQLMSLVFDLARRNGNDVVWLGVSEHNVRAIALYRKHGFEPRGLHNVGLGDHVHQDLLMSSVVR
jgi:ribosomal protein S18 acetylase RimI-like enzyme